MNYPPIMSSPLRLPPITTSRHHYTEQPSSSDRRKSSDNRRVSFASQHRIREYNPKSRNEDSDTSHDSVNAEYTIQVSDTSDSEPTSSRDNGVQRRFLPHNSIMESHLEEDLLTDNDDLSGLSTVTDERAYSYSLNSVLKSPSAIPAADLLFDPTASNESSSNTPNPPLQQQEPTSPPPNKTGDCPTTTHSNSSTPSHLPIATPPPKPTVNHQILNTPAIDLLRSRSYTEFDTPAEFPKSLMESPILYVANPSRMNKGIQGELDGENLEVFSRPSQFLRATSSKSTFNATDPIPSSSLYPSLNTFSDILDNPVNSCELSVPNDSNASPNSSNGCTNKPHWTSPDETDDLMQYITTNGLEVDGEMDSNDRLQEAGTATKPGLDTLQTVPLSDFRNDHNDTLKESAGDPVKQLDVPTPADMTLSGPPPMANPEIQGDVVVNSTPSNTKDTTSVCTSKPIVVVEPSSALSTPIQERVSEFNSACTHPPVPNTHAKPSPVPSSTSLSNMAIFHATTNARQCQDQELNTDLSLVPGSKSNAKLTSHMHATPSIPNSLPKSPMPSLPINDQSLACENHHQNDDQLSMVSDENGVPTGILQVQSQDKGDALCSVNQQATPPNPTRHVISADLQNLKHTPLNKPGPNMKYMTSPPRQSVHSPRSVLGMSPTNHRASKQRSQISATPNVPISLTRVHSTPIAKKTSTPTRPIREKLLSFATRSLSVLGTPGSSSATTTTTPIGHLATSSVVVPDSLLTGHHASLLDLMTPGRARFGRAVHVLPTPIKRETPAGSAKTPMLVTTPTPEKSYHAPAEMMLTPIGMPGPSTMPAPVPIAMETPTSEPMATELSAPDPTPAPILGALTTPVCRTGFNQVAATPLSGRVNRMLFGTAWEKQQSTPTKSATRKKDDIIAVCTDSNTEDVIVSQDQLTHHNDDDVDLMQVDILSFVSGDEEMEEPVFKSHHVGQLLHQDSNDPSTILCAILDAGEVKNAVLGLTLFDNVLESTDNPAGEHQSSPAMLYEAVLRDYPMLIQAHAHCKWLMESIHRASVYGNDLEQVSGKSPPPLFHRWLESRDNVTLREFLIDRIKSTAGYASIISQLYALQYRWDLVVEVVHLYEETHAGLVKDVESVHNENVLVNDVCARVGHVVEEHVHACQMELNRRECDQRVLDDQIKAVRDKVLAIREKRAAIMNKLEDYDRYERELRTKCKQETTRNQEIRDKITQSKRDQATLSKRATVEEYLALVRISRMMSAISGWAIDPSTPKRIVMIYRNLLRVSMSNPVDTIALVEGEWTLDDISMPQSQGPTKNLVNMLVSQLSSRIANEPQAQEPMGLGYDTIPSAFAWMSARFDCWMDLDMLSRDVLVKYWSSVEVQSGEELDTIRQADKQQWVLTVKLYGQEKSGAQNAYRVNLILAVDPWTWHAGDPVHVFLSVYYGVAHASQVIAAVQDVKTGVWIDLVRCADLAIQDMNRVI